MNETNSSKTNNAKKLYMEKYSIFSIYRSQGIHTCFGDERLVRLRG